MIFTDTDSFISNYRRGDSNENNKNLRKDFNHFVKRPVLIFPGTRLSHSRKNG